MKFAPYICRTLCVFISLVAFNYSAISNTPSSITYQDYAALPDFDMFTISPNGKMFAYRNTTSGKQMALIYSRTENKTLRVFDMQGLKVNGLEFLTDNYLIVRVAESKRIPGSKKRREYSTAMAYDISTNNITQLLQLGDIIYENQTGLGRIISLSENHKYAYMPAYIGGNLDVPDYGVLRVNLKRPKKPKISFQGFRESLDFYLNRDGDAIVHEILFDRSDSYEIRAKNKNKWETIYKSESSWSPFNIVGLSTDESKLIVLDRNRGNTVKTYHEMSLADGSLKEFKLSAEAASRDIDHVYSDSGRHVQGVAYTGFNRGYYFFDENLNGRVQSILKLFEGNSVFIVDITDDLKHVLVRVEGSNYVGDYFIFTEGKQGEFLTSSRQKFSPEDIHPISRISLNGRDGQSIPTLVTIPKRHISSIKNLPTVVLPHGGPASHDRIHFDWWAQALANEGYLIVQPQFRGSTGFGNDHYYAGFGEWGRGMQNDVTDAVNALISKGYVDKERICIMGGSYGGYAALAGGAFTPDLYKCVVAINGVSDLNRFLKQERRDHRAYSSSVAYWEDMLFGYERENKIDLKRISPFNHAKAFKAPVLLFHGRDDNIVNIEQSNVMKRALASADKKVEYIQLSGEHHYLRHEESRIKLLENAVRFIGESIGE